LAPGVDAGVAAQSALDVVVEQCRTGNGQECDPASFISKLAAICVAAEAMSSDAETWSASLEVQREIGNSASVEWLVLGAGPRDNQCCATGQWFRIDAVTSEIVSQTETREVCCPS